MTTYLLKTNCELYLNGAEPRPTAARQWEGATVTAWPPKKLGGAPGKEIEPGDDLIIWTHEDRDYGNGLGLTATATAVAVTIEGETRDVMMQNVKLIRPHLRLSDQPADASGSRLLDSLKVNRLRRTIELADEDVEQFWMAVEDAERRRDALISASSQSLPRSEQERSIDADHQGIAEGFERRFANVETRPGQGPFRNELIRIYGAKCLVTGCRVLAALEAAHIVPFSLELPYRNDVENGLLMRADIHALYDRFMLSIRPVNGEIVIAASLKGTPYERYEGRVIRHKANKAFLIRQFEEFRRRTQRMEMPTIK